MSGMILKQPKYIALCPQVECVAEPVQVCLDLVMSDPKAVPMDVSYGYQIVSKRINQQSPHGS